MKNLLEEKKIMVVNELIKTLGHKNQNDIEASLKSPTMKNQKLRKKIPN